MNTDPKTVDEIVKALKCCSRVDAQCIGCNDCPFEYCGPECNALCKNAHDLIESLQAQLSEKPAEIKRLNDEPPAYKFYYCESENSYLLGRRMDTMYYAHWYDGYGFVWDMSRYLPWGEHVVALHTAWKEHTYPSEPKEIDSSEWFKGFLAQRLSASQRREQEAVEDWKIYEENGQCDVCKYGEGGGCVYPEGNRCRFEWRGKAGKEKVKEVQNE